MDQGFKLPSIWSYKWLAVFQLYSEIMLSESLKLKSTLNNTGRVSYLMVKQLQKKWKLKRIPILARFVLYGFFWGAGVSFFSQSSFFFFSLKSKVT